ncbi:hypothetical protein [Cyclobacterium jeungdonense]|uniref:Uncharacterized protein n=1 Tax=Cyclobacterium jeungdonense TaxID=708087 RepID=A0ABT8C4W6_9BACT|nr:hypothetical protein [Cyclobacterium jeungdonense]MDN3686791.1 hypothetical protein [Cyclobacterium jeungdonense]
MAKKKDNSKYPTEAEIEKYKMLSELIDSLIAETKELSKKKPDEALNKLKIKMINRVLDQLKEILKTQPTIEFLDLLDENELPSNSDAVLILGQFRAAMDRFRKTYYGKTSNYESSRRWFTRENPGEHYNSSY